MHQVKKDLEMMFQRFLVNAALILFVAIFCVFVTPSSHAQLLTGYDNNDVALEVAANEPPAQIESPSGYQPLLTSNLLVSDFPEASIPFERDHDFVEPPVSSSVLEPVYVGQYDAPEREAKTNSYSNFLTNPIKQSGSNDPGDPNEQPLDIEADTMRFDNDRRIASASGNVIMVQDGRILRADETEYAIDEDIVRARGNVVLNETNGDVYLSQAVEYSNKLQNGTVDDLESTLVDGSRFTAETGRRVDGKVTIMDAATYTACEACRNEDGELKRLPWQIKASKVTHNEETARIAYRNARFNVYGVPVAYTPYFSHPDGTIDRKSGLLAPSFGYTSELGAFLKNEFYWNIAPDKDATFGLQVMTEQAPLGLVEYRQRWQDAGITINGGLTYSDRTEDDSSSDTNVTSNDELRGHIFAEGRWDINDNWRSGLEIEYVSDDQYANQYDVTDEDVLQNTLYAERFSGRNYGIGQVQLYQDLRTSDLVDDQPGVLPELYASYIGEAGAVPIIKGRWDASFGFLSLYREGDDQDVVRASVDLGWERRLVSDYGLVSDIDVTLRGDAYYVNNADGTTTQTGNESDTTEARFFPQINVKTSYPVARNFENSQLVIEPIASLTASTKSTGNDDIPNEDSQDVQIDASNLFEANRFPGLDLVEDRSRATYGMRVALNGHESSDAEVFLGQSYRFDQDNNPFQEGSGLSDQSSDVVGYIKGDYKDVYSLEYRFQLDNDSLGSSRHELDAYADWNKFRLGANYLFAQALEGTEITEDREQVMGSAEYYFNDKWRTTLSTQYDLGESNPGLRTAQIGLDYYGQCVSWSFVANRTLTDDSSGDSDTEILFTIGLRNISEFMRTGLRDDSN